MRAHHIEQLQQVLPDLHAIEHRVRVLRGIALEHSLGGPRGLTSDELWELLRLETIIEQYERLGLLDEDDEGDLSDLP